MAPRPRYKQFAGNKSASYLATAETAEIVNLAVRLGRPILVEGEAGCGKTRLASAIAEELGLLDQLTVMTVKSTSEKVSDTLISVLTHFTSVNPAPRTADPLCSFLGQQVSHTEPKTLTLM